MKKTLILILLLAATAAFAQTTGPKNGHLIIAGGALRDPDVFAKFIELAKGDESHIVVIPTAGGFDVNEETEAGIIRQWKARGAKEVTVLHTTDPKDADMETLLKPLMMQPESISLVVGNGDWRILI